MNLDKPQNGHSNAWCLLIQKVMFCVHSGKEPLALCMALCQVAFKRI